MPPVSVFMRNRLHEWRIHRVCGYPDDGINGFLGAAIARAAATGGWRARRG